MSRQELPARLIGIVAATRLKKVVPRDARPWIERLAKGQLEPSEQIYVTVTLGEARGLNSGSIDTIRELASEVLARTKRENEGGVKEWHCPCEPGTLKRTLYTARK
jgi:hypothetical protein